MGRNPSWKLAGTDLLCLQNRLWEATQCDTLLLIGWQQQSALLSGSVGEILFCEMVWHERRVNKDECLGSIWRQHGGRECLEKTTVKWINTVKEYWRELVDEGLSVEGRGCLYEGGWRSYCCGHLKEASMREWGIRAIHRFIDRQVLWTSSVWVSASNWWKMHFGSRCVSQQQECLSVVTHHVVMGGCLWDN